MLTRTLESEQFPGQQVEFGCGTADRQLYSVSSLPGAGDELQGIKRGLLELVDVIAVNKADRETRMAAEVAARQYETALKSLVGRGEDTSPTVLTCSALENKGVDRVWDAIEQRCERMRRSGEQADRRRQQNLRWLWAIVDDQVHQAIRRHPRVQSLRASLEHDVLAGDLPAEAAARRILELSGFLKEAQVKGSVT